MKQATASSFLNEKREKPTPIPQQQQPQQQTARG